MEERIEQQRLAKQTYLRQNIRQDCYGKFAEFCQNEAGGTNIDQWTYEYVEDLVQRFNISLQPTIKILNTSKQQNSCERSLDISHISAISNIKQVSSKFKDQAMNIAKPGVDMKEYKKNMQNAGLNVLNSVIQNTSNIIKQKIQQKKQKGNKAQNCIDPQKQKKLQQSKSGLWGMLSNDTVMNTVKIGIGIGLSKLNQDVNPSQTSKQEKKDSHSKQNKENDYFNGQQNQLYSKLEVLDKPTYPQQFSKCQLKQNITCKKAQVNKILADPTTTIKISKYEIVNKVFFIPDYVMYNLVLTPKNIECKRNYEDFLKLRKTLNLLYPGVQLPFLQKKTNWLSETNPEMIKQQISILEQFLNDILHNVELRNSKIFQYFLTFQEHKKMKRKFQDLQKQGKVKSIEQLCLINNNIKINLNQQQRHYCEKATPYLTKMQELFEKYKKLLEVLSYQYETVIKTLNSLSELMMEFKFQTNKFNQEVNTNQFSRVTQIFDKLFMYYADQSNNKNFDYKIINESIRPFISYERDNISTLREVLSTNSMFTILFQNRLHTEKLQNQTYLDQKLKQYKVALADDSKNLHVFKYQTGYFNTQACKETQRMFETLGIKIEEKWDDIAQKYLLRLSQNVSLWHQFLLLSN